MYSELYLAVERAHESIIVFKYYRQTIRQEVNEYQHIKMKIYLKEINIRIRKFLFGYFRCCENKSE